VVVVVVVVVVVESSPDGGSSSSSQPGLTTKPIQDSFELQGVPQAIVDSKNAAAGLNAPETKASPKAKTPTVGYHEESGRYFDGAQWSIDWKQNGAPTDPAIAIMPDGREVAMQSILTSDLIGEGIIIVRNFPMVATKAKAKAPVKPRHWEQKGTPF